jgi:hypothetical protein
MAFSICNRAVILSVSSAEVEDEDDEEEGSVGEGAGAFRYRRRKGGIIYGRRCGGIRRGFGVTASGESGDAENTDKRECTYL